MPSILIVDDDADLSAIVARYLESEGFAVERAASAEELARAVPKNTAQAVYVYFHKTEEETPCE